MYKKSLNRVEAELIVSIVEEILIEKKLPYVYLLSDLQGYNRLDVANAFLLSIAEMCFELGVDKINNKDFIAYVQAAGSANIAIATQGIPDVEFISMSDKTDERALRRLSRKWSLFELPNQNKEDINPSIDQERKEYVRMETSTSFSEFCVQLLLNDSDSFWDKVYERIGLEIPSADIRPQNLKKTGCLGFIVLLIGFIGSIFYLY